MTTGDIAGENIAALSLLHPGLGAHIVVVMPAFNESENIGFVLQTAPKDVAGFAVRYLVVDDGSTDGTAAVAETAGAIVVRAAKNGGGGRALRLGYLAAERLGAQVVVTMDADGQHQFADLPALIAPIVEGRAEFVVGSRRLGHQVGGDSTRALGVTVFNAVLTVVLRRRISDCASGYRAFRMADLARLHLVQDRHHTAETLIEAHRCGLRLLEVPITIFPRHSGQSKKGPTWKYAFRFARTVVVTTARKKRGS